MSELDLYKAIGQRIRDFRVIARLSQRKLGELSGNGRETIAKIELGLQSITVMQLRAIAQALCVPVESLFESTLPQEKTALELGFRAGYEAALEYMKSELCSASERIEALTDFNSQKAKATETNDRSSASEDK